MANIDPALQEIKALSLLIAQSVDSIEKVLLSRGQQFPSPHEPFTKESEASRMAPDVLPSCGIITAAAAQLIAAVRPPAASAMFTAAQVLHLHLRIGPP